MPQTQKKIELIMALRRQGITDARVLSAIESVPREKFVSPGFEERAYENNALPIECGQTISQPFVVAYMTEQLDVQPRDRVLEVGTGSGYQAAVLARLCRRVYTIERHTDLYRQAEKRLAALDISNVTTFLADGSEGWKEQAPFDRIIVTAGTPNIPQALVDHLVVGGIMVAPIGESSENQRLVRLVKLEESLQMEDLLPVRFVPLVKGVARGE